jgi:hypothetical protein
MDWVVRYGSILKIFLPIEIFEIFPPIEFF